MCAMGDPHRQSAMVRIKKELMVPHEALAQRVAEPRGWGGGCHCVGREEEGGGTGGWEPFRGNFKGGMPLGDTRDCGSSPHGLGLDRGRGHTNRTNQP